MKKILVLIAFSLIFTLMLVACDSNSEQVAETTAAQETEPATQEVTTEQVTEEVTTAEQTTAEQTTQAEVAVVHPSVEEVKAASVAFLDAAAMQEAANNP